MHNGRSHLVIPDIQAKPGVDLSHLTWIGEYILAKKPDVIVCLGDFADMESLCSYDRGKKSFEGRRYKEDVKAAKTAMAMLLAPLKKYNKKQKEKNKPQYKPEMYLTLGNHEERIMRVAEMMPELDGIVGYSDLPFYDWHVYDFLVPVEVDGITYVHYLANPMTGKPYGGNAANMLLKTGRTFIVGHKQTLDITTRFTISGKQQWGIVAGACYLHDERYKGPQGNMHWRGLLYLHRVVDGSFDPMFISLDYLRDRFSKT